MAQWQRNIKLNPEWGKAADGEISIQELAAVVARKLRALTPFSDESIDEKRIELADEFDWIAGSADATEDDFDGWMEELYDWGDIQISGQFFDAKKVCFIDTFSEVPA